MTVAQGPASERRRTLGSVLAAVVIVTVSIGLAAAVVRGLLALAGAHALMSAADRPPRVPRPPDPPPK